MSCCDNCNQGLGCCDGLGQLPAVSSYTVAGSVIAWGGHILLPGSDTAAGWGDDVEGGIKNALWSHGGFSMVNAGRESGFFNPYISIKVTTRVDFAHLVDILRTIEGAVYQAGFRPETQAFWIESVPQSAVGNQTVAQPGIGGSVNQGTSSGSGIEWPSLPNLSDIFGGSSGSDNRNLLDRLAETFNVTQTQAAVIGAGLAIGGIFLLKRIL